MINISNDDFQRLTEYIKSSYGINLSQKKTLIEGRLSNLLREKGYDNFRDYLEMVFTDSTQQEIALLLDKLTTNHTFFLREKVHFEFFREEVLPYLCAKVRQKDLRIWSAGCSSGQEPYTLAMIIADYFGREKSDWDTKILATDISNQVLRAATAGIYPADMLQDLPSVWKLNYFKKTENDYYRVIDRLKAELIIRKFNLTEPVFPFKKNFHVIFCRNVMIYFENKTKMDLIHKFYELTEPGGYLFIGLAEGIDRTGNPYRTVMPAVYRKD